METLIIGLQRDESVPFTIGKLIKKKSVPSKMGLSLRNRPRKELLLQNRCVKMFLAQPFIEEKKLKDFGNSFQRKALNAWHCKS